MNNFQLSLWSQQNSVNQIIHLFDDNVGTLPGELHYKQAFLAFLWRAVQLDNVLNIQCLTFQ